MFFQENLDSFLAIAEELQLEGMLGGIENREMYTMSSPPSPPPRTPQTPPSPPPQKIEKFTKQSKFHQSFASIKHCHSSWHPTK